MNRHSSSHVSSHSNDKIHGEFYVDKTNNYKEDYYNPYIRNNEFNEFKTNVHSIIDKIDPKIEKQFEKQNEFLDLKINNAIKDLKIELNKDRSNLIKWLIGISIGAISAIVAIIKFFSFL